MTLHRNGKFIKSTPLNVVAGIVQKVPPGAADYTITTKATRKDFSYSALSTQVDVAWKFRSAWTAKPTNLPVRSVGIAPQGLDDFNRAKGGSTSGLTIWADYNRGTGPVKVKTLKVQASFDDGKTWKPLTLTNSANGWIAKVINPASGFVSLRAQMADEHGNTVDQTVIRAYAIGS